MHFFSDERRVVGFAGGPDVAKTPEAQTASPDGAKIEKPEDVVKAAKERIGNASTAIQNLDVKIKDLQSVLTKLNTFAIPDVDPTPDEKEGVKTPEQVQQQLQQHLQNQDAQAAAPVPEIDVAALLEKHGIVVNDPENKDEVKTAVTTAIDSATAEREQHVQMATEAGGALTEAEQKILDSGDAFTRLGVRMDQLKRAKTFDEMAKGFSVFLGEVAACIGELKNMFHGIANKPTSKEGKESDGSAKNTSTPLAERVRTEGAAKVKAETVAKKEEAVKALNGDGTNPGLQKEKEKLTQKKATLTTELELAERDLAASKPDAPDRAKLEENVTKAKNALQLIDTQLTQVETDIKKHNETLITAAKTLNEIDDLLKQTQKDVDKLNTLSSQVAAGITAAGAQNLPESKAIMGMLSPVLFLADGASVKIEVNGDDLAHATETIKGLGMDAASLKTRLEGAVRYVEDPQAFIGTLEKLTGVLQQKMEGVDASVGKMKEAGLDEATAKTVAKLNAEENLQMSYEHGALTLPPIEAAGADHIKSVLNILSANRAPGAISKSITDVLRVRVKDVLSNTDSLIGKDALKHTLTLFTPMNWHTEKIADQLHQLKKDVPGVGIALNDNLQGLSIFFNGDKDAIKNHTIFQTLDPLIKTQFSV